MLSLQRMAGILKVYMFIVWLYLLKNVLSFEFSPVKERYYNKEDNNLGNAHMYISGLSIAWELHSRFSPTLSTSMIIREHTARPLTHIPIQEITLIYSDLLEDDGASLSSLMNLNICHFLQCIIACYLCSHSVSVFHTNGTFSAT